MGGVDGPARGGRPAFASRGRSQSAVLCEAAMLRLDCTAALASRLGGKVAILSEAALLVRDVGTALAGDLALLLLLHAGKSAQRSGSLALILMSHAVSPC